MNNLELARQVFESGEYAFVLARGGKVLATGTRPGIAELLDALAAHGAALRGAALADKIVGKAVAMVAVHAGIAEVYTPLGSEPALWVLQKYGIAFAADRLVPLIRNQQRDGACPMEQLTLPLTDPADAVAALRAFVAPKPPLPTSITEK